MPQIDATVHQGWAESHLGAAEGGASRLMVVPYGGPWHEAAHWTGWFVHTSVNKYQAVGCLVFTSETLIDLPRSSSLSDVDPIHQFPGLYSCYEDILVNASLDTSMHLHAFIERAL